MAAGKYSIQMAVEAQEGTGDQDEHNESGESGASETWV